MEHTITPTHRELSADELAVLRDLYLLKAQLRDTVAYVTAATPLELSFPQMSPGGWTYARKTVPAGTVLKIVMVSRFGDVGLTDQLDATHGYGLRLMPDDTRIRDIRREP